MILRTLYDYGMIIVLFVLAGLFSALSYTEQYYEGAVAARRLAPAILKNYGAEAKVVIASTDNALDVEFATELDAQLKQLGVTPVDVVNGKPSRLRSRLEGLIPKGQVPHVISTNQSTASWLLLDTLGDDFPEYEDTSVIRLGSYWWPAFLRSDNLLNISNQIAVIAIIAIGMTMVIITAGIDLSVGSLIALSSVVAALLIRDQAGAEQASSLGMIWCSLVAIAVSALVGLFSGTMITGFSIPPFIVTLAMMMVARGMSGELTANQSVYQLPDSFVWLGRNADLFRIPNAVVLMFLLYLIAHVTMTRTTLGRAIYAVGGNREAARLSGIPVLRVLLFVYTLSGALAGLGGIVMASQLKSGSPTYGYMYELYVIAAVVVGGTSLAGGEGKILGTLIGAFIIAVINNGMNLCGVGGNMQQVVLGLVILTAVFLDGMKKGEWRNLVRLLGASR